MGYTKAQKNCLLKNKLFKSKNITLPMKTIYSEKVPRILKNKKQLEKELDVKITNRGKEVYVEGKAVDEYDAGQIIDALNFGFPFSHAMSIRRDEFLFEIINIKDHTRRKDLVRIRGRIIGTEGRAKKTIENLTNSIIVINQNQIAIIVNALHLDVAIQAIISILQGAKHANVFTYLEKQNAGIKKIKYEDLGLKEGVE